MVLIIIENLFYCNNTATNLIIFNSTVIILLQQCSIICLTVKMLKMSI